MKRFLLMTFIFTCAFSLTQAQRGTGERPSQGGGGQGQRFDPAQMIERRVQELKDSISLTDAQAVKVKEIYTKSSEKQRETFTKMREAREAGTEIDREEMRKQMEASRTQESNEIKALLTAPQKVKYEKYLVNAAARMRNFGNRGGGGGPR